MNKPVHNPVMVEEVVRLFAEISPSLMVDGTVGLGGHAEALLTSLSLSLLVGIDGDETALGIAERRLEPFDQRVKLVQGSYCEVDEILERLGYEKVDGILLDLGLSSLQVDDPARGFSFISEGPLDMRMDRSRGLTAWDVVNSYPQRELERVIREYGEERWARRITMRIVEERRVHSIDTTTELANLVSRAIPRRFHPRRIHPATRTFQAIRMEVNGELQCLDKFLKLFPGVVANGGRVVVISFHSLEDRMVKRAFRELEDSGGGIRVTKRPLVPSEEEVQKNPRARSAKLRCFEVRK